MKEIEILFELKDSKEDALNKLSHLKSKGIVNTLDEYYVDPNNDLFKPVNNQILHWLRIRTQKGLTKITFKKDHLNGDVWSHSDEYETVVKDYDVLKNIFLSLGFKQLVKVDNEKHIFLQDDYEIVLEDVKNLGLFLEIEKLNSKDDENVEEIRKEIFSLAKSLNLSLGEELHIGKPELMLKKFT